MNEIWGSSVLILGYSREGQSVHRYLKINHPDVKIGIADRQMIRPIIKDRIDIYTGANYLENLTRYDTVIRSPGVPLYLPRFKKYLHARQHITSATNIFFSQCQGVTIGVTGTKGKSTTSTLIFQLLKKKITDVRLVGNIGSPAPDQLANHTSRTVFVIELSSHQLEDCRYSPEVAVILAIVPEHLDHFTSFSKYVSAKSHIIKYQSRTEWVIYNPTHQVTRILAERSLAKKVIFSLRSLVTSQYWLDNDKIFLRDNDGDRKGIMPLSEIPLIGKGNIENTLAALAVAHIFNVTLTQMRSVVKKFRSLPHRLEKVGTFKSITFYNDSLSTVPESTIHALEALKPRVATLIAGGMDRGLDYTIFGKYINRYHGLRTLILFPDTGEYIWTSIKKNVLNQKGTLKKYQVTTMKEAVRLAFKHTTRGKICLLSPAAASFNLYRNYQERGELFKKYVKSYSNAIS